VALRLGDGCGGVFDALSDISGQMIHTRNFLRIFLESTAKDCYSRVVDKLITEVASTVKRRGGPRVWSVTTRQGRSVNTRGYSFVPSPSANLVGVAKKLRLDSRPFSADQSF